MSYTFAYQDLSRIELVPSGGTKLLWYSVMIAGVLSEAERLAKIWYMTDQSAHNNLAITGLYHLATTLSIAHFP